MQMVLDQFDDIVCNVVSQLTNDCQPKYLFFLKLYFFKLGQLGPYMELRNVTSFVFFCRPKLPSILPMPIKAFKP